MEYVELDADFYLLHFKIRNTLLWINLVQKFKILSLS